MRGFPNSLMGLSTGWWTQASYFSPRCPTCQARGLRQSTKSFRGGADGEITHGETWASAGEYTPTQWGWQGGGDTVCTSAGGSRELKGAGAHKAAHTRKWLRLCWFVCVRSCRLTLLHLKCCLTEQSLLNFKGHSRSWLCQLFTASPGASCSTSQWCSSLHVREPIYETDGRSKTISRIESNLKTFTIKNKIQFHDLTLWWATIVQQYIDIKRPHWFFFSKQETADLGLLWRKAK